MNQLTWGKRSQEQLTSATRSRAAHSFGVSAFPDRAGLRSGGRSLLACQCELGPDVPCASAAVPHSSPLPQSPPCMVRDPAGHSCCWTSHGGVVSCLGGILTVCGYPALHRVLNSPALHARGQPCSPSCWEAGDQCAGLGFLDGSHAVPQLCLRDHFLCTQNYCSWTFSAKGPRVTRLVFNLPVTKPLVAKSHPFLHDMSQCFRHQKETERS